MNGRKNPNMETFLCTSGDRLGKAHLNSHRGNSKMYVLTDEDLEEEKISHRKNPTNIQRKLEKTRKRHHDEEDIQEGLLKN